MYEGNCGYLLVDGLVYFCSNLLLSSVYLLCIFIRRAQDAAEWDGRLSGCFILRVTDYLRFRLASLVMTAPPSPHH